MENKKWIGYNKRSEGTAGICDLNKMLHSHSAEAEERVANWLALGFHLDEGDLHVLETIPFSLMNSNLPNFVRRFSTTMIWAN